MIALLHFISVMVKMMQLFAAVLNDAIDNLSRLVCNLNDMISPVLSAAYTYQKNSNVRLCSM